MKNILIGMMIAVLSFGAFLVPTFALQASGTVTVTVLVQGSFTLLVDTDSFDFARLMPGQAGKSTRKEGIAVSGISTAGNPWFLKISTSGPLSSGSDFIPNENFTWYGTSEGKGEWHGSTDKSFADANNTAYISSIDESALAAKVTSKFNFKLRVPEATRPGNYTTTVMFTMTE